MGKKVLGDAKFKQAKKFANQKSGVATFAKTFGNEFVRESKRQSRARSKEPREYEYTEPVEWYWTLLGALICALPFVAIYVFLFV